MNEIVICYPQVLPRLLISLGSPDSGNQSLVHVLASSAVLPWLMLLNLAGSFAAASPAVITRPFPSKAPGISVLSL